MKKYFIVVLLNIVCTLTFAQDQSPLQSYALPSLTLQQSPLLMGAGQIGTAVLMQDAIGFYYNPAQLGYFSRTNSLSGFFMPQKASLSSFSPDVTFQTSSVTIGTHVTPPLSIGFGYIHNKIGYGTFSIANSNNPNSRNKYESYDSFDGYSLGFGYNYYLLFNFGFSVKSFRSILNENNYNNGNTYRKIEGTAFDFGAMIVTPISKLLLNNTKFYVSDDAALRPKIDFTLGYSINNIGKKVWYVDPSQADPLPRTARLGYSLNLGMDLSMLGTKLNTINYSFTAEAEDILIMNDNDTTGVKYQDMLGDISIKKHLIDLKGDNNVLIHRGHIFRLLETVILSSGRISGNYHRDIKSNGFGISSEGIFKVLSTLTDNSTLNYIADHLVLEYYSSNVNTDSGNSTSFKGLAIYVRSFGF